MKQDRGKRECPKGLQEPKAPGSLANNPDRVELRHNLELSGNSRVWNIFKITEEREP